MLFSLRRLDNPVTTEKKMSFLEPTLFFLLLFPFFFKIIMYRKTWYDMQKSRFKIQF